MVQDVLLELNIAESVVEVQSSMELGQMCTAVAQGNTFWMALMMVLRIPVGLVVAIFLTWALLTGIRHVRNAAIRHKAAGS